MRLHHILRFAFVFTLVLALIPTVLSVSQDSDFDELEEASRRALLSYYNSQTMTHGGYIIALVIGGLTLISRWREFAGGKGKIWWKLKIRWRWIMFILIISGIIALGVYMIGRTLWWGYLASAVISVNVDEERTDDRTIMSELHLKSGEEVCNGTESLLVYWAITCKSALQVRMGLVIGVLLISMFILLCFSRWCGPLSPTFQLNERGNKQITYS